MIWKRTFNLGSLNESKTTSLVNHLDIKFTNSGDDFLEGTMPVDERTKQPYGILHGGASVALAETLGSVASSLCIPKGVHQIPVGIEINANHLKSVTSGEVTGRATSVRIGRSLHVWSIEIRNNKNELTCMSRLTCMIIDKK